MTPEQMNAFADALECFWNSSIGSARQSQDTTAMAVAGALSEGFAAMARRLREASPEKESCAETAAAHEFKTQSGRFAERLYSPMKPSLDKKVPVDEPWFDKTVDQMSADEKSKALNYTLDYAGELQSMLLESWQAAAALSKSHRRLCDLLSR